MSRDRKAPNLTPLMKSRVRSATFLDRIDPQHEIEWADAVQVRWSDIGGTRYSLALTPSGTLGHSQDTVWSPIDVSAASLYSIDAMRTVAGLVQFHQLSTMQVATLLDSTPLIAFRTLRDLFYHGVLEMASPGWWYDDDDRPKGGTGCIWRLDLRSPRLEEWLDGLEDLEYLLIAGGSDVTKGTPGQSSPTAARHNLSLAEIMIRTLEVCQGAVGVWGEPQARADLFHEHDNDEIRKNIADGVIIGKDGRILLVETTGNSSMDDGAVSTRIRDKVSAWAAIIARSKLDLRLVFVDISQKSNHRRFRWHVLEGAREVDRYLSRARQIERTQSRIFTVNAREWFPIGSMIAQGFGTMEAFSPFDNRYHDLLPSDLRINPYSDTVVNTLGAMHTPAWINREVAPLGDVDAS